MQYRTLGHSGLSVSEISFGCMSLEVASSKVPAILHRAIDLGINLFDTADLYDKGVNEEVVGAALKNKRDHVLIASKVGNQWKADGSGWDWNPRKEYILDCIDKSLQRLKTDHIDLYQLHGGTMEDPIDDVIETFERLQQAGKIRFYGISSIRPQVIREWVKRSRLTSVMMQYSLLDRRPEESSLSLLKENNIGVLARGTLAKGMLAGKPASVYLDHSEREVQTASYLTASLSGAARSASQTATQFVLSHQAITTAVTGIRTLAQLEDAVAASAVPALTTAERERLRAAIPARQYDQHR